MAMKSETLEEARARLKEMTQQEREGMESVSEGQLMPATRTSEMEHRAQQVDAAGEASFAANADLREDRYAESVAAATADDAVASAEGDVKSLSSRGSKRYQTK